MDGLTAVLVTLIGTIGTVLVAALRARRQSRVDGPSAAARWRDQAALEKARADLLDEQLDDERQARAAAIETNRQLLEQIDRTRHDLDDCVRQRDNAFSDLRAARRGRPSTP